MLEKYCLILLIDNCFIVIKDIFDCHKNGKKDGTAGAREAVES